MNTKTHNWLVYKELGTLELSPQWDACITPLPLRYREGEQKELRARFQGNSFPQQGRGTHELTSVITLCTRPAKPQARQKPNTMERVGMKPPVVEELLAFDYYWKRKSQWASVG